MKALISTLLLSATCVQLTVAQYEFHDEQRVGCTSVKSQDITGTCWSYSTSSFLESELMRMGKGEYDLSEMFIVRNIYMDKARNYILRQGAANFSEGALAHDLLRMFDEKGVVPNDAYPGLLGEDSIHNHAELEAGMKGFLDGVRTQKKVGDKWPQAMEGILDAYLGEAPNEFTYKGKKYNPKSFAQSLGLKSSDYIGFTSFSHHPFGKPFIIEIPDNYSNGSYNNVPIDDLMKLIDYALENGYSLAWDGDVSEKGIGGKQGIAIIPSDLKRDSVFYKPGEEIEATQELRQQQFESLQTTDDHLMHIIGTAKDQRGTKYYIVKNSWGEIGPFKGYFYMSETYMRMKTVSVYLHKDGVPKAMKP
ncbi:MAG: C1 family peptidase [Flavobacteriales bacterium]